MAGAFRRVMVYLGLVDDEYDDYGDYEDPQPVAPTRQAPRSASYAPEAVEMNAGVRTLPRDSDMGGSMGGGVSQGSGVGGVTIQPRPQVVRPLQPTQAA